MRDDLAVLLSEQFATARPPVPAARVSPAGPRPLPVGTTSIFGREADIDEVAGMAPPADPAATPVQQLAASPAVALFVDRLLRSGLRLTEGNAAAVVEICRRLEGLLLAIELAAARTRLLDPVGLLDRLAASVDALGTGTVDMPERQRTLRAAVEWSVDLLDDSERSLLETMGVFVDGWTDLQPSLLSRL